ncbi:hypothetical protein V2J09_012405 [Rumex salicifolius]
MRPSPGSCSSSRKSSQYRRSFDLPSDDELLAAEAGDRHSDAVSGGGMLPVFLNNLRSAAAISAPSSVDWDSQDLVEVEFEVDETSNIVLRSVTPTSASRSAAGFAGSLARSFSSASNRLRESFRLMKSSSVKSVSSAATPSVTVDLEQPTITNRDRLRIAGQLSRNRSCAQRALKGLRFISQATGSDSWAEVEARFDKIAEAGLITREEFGECIGMVDSKEFAEGMFDALARRKRQRITKISKEEMYDFWTQLTDQSFDARLQIFFDMVDKNGDGKITTDEVQELILLSASANKLGVLMEKAQEYANLIMEELDPDNLNYIELWQLEMLLLRKDVNIDYSKPLSTASFGWSQNLSQNLNSLRPKNVVRRVSCTLKCIVLENWQRFWIVFLWLMVMAGLFTWKFMQYRNRAAFQVMGYCLCTAKGAAETIKLNMALILLPVCRNTLTRLRSTTARLFIPFDDNINFHRMIAFAIVIGTVLHAGNHLVCDFPRLINSSPEKFSLIASSFNYKKPTYGELLTGIEGITGIAMVVLMVISFTLATGRFRRNIIKLPAPFNRLAGYNAFWYSHHLLGLVYVFLLIHGIFLFLVQSWKQKTTWMYISFPIMMYLLERSLRTCRSEYYPAKIIKISELPGGVFSIIMSKPQGFKYRSGQYIFLQCPTISKFEWHPFSITSAPGDNYISVHIQIAGDWTQELKRVFTEGIISASTIGRLSFNETQSSDHKNSPRLLVDGPYGAPAQDYQNYDVLLLVGLGIGATPFVSILRDLLNTKRAEDRMDSCTETSTSDDSLNSIASSTATQPVKKRMRTKSAHFYWVTREYASFEWFKGVMDDVAEMDHKGLIDMHNYLTSVYEEGDARSTLITMVNALNHAKYGVDILSGTRVKTHFARPNWNEVFTRIAKKHPYSTVELKKLSHEMSHKTSTRFEFHKELF